MARPMMYEVINFSENTYLLNPLGLDIHNQNGQCIFNEYWDGENIYGSKYHPNDDASLSDSDSATYDDSKDYQYTVASVTGVTGGKLAHNKPALYVNEKQDNNKYDINIGLGNKNIGVDNNKHNGLPN